MLLGAAVAGLVLTGCAGTGPVQSGSSYNRNVLIVNQTGRTIWRFYGSNVGTNSWEEDILGSDVLASGGAVNIDFNDGSGYCNFDMKAEFQDGSSVVQNNIDVCAVSSVTFY
jgi:hypothetical protein